MEIGSSGERIVEAREPRRGIFGFLKEDACNVCGRKLGRNDLKIVMPSSFFEANSEPVAKRYLCRNCYSRFARKSASRRSKVQSGASQLNKNLAVYSVEA